ncbi:tetratricopeptide repeat-containing sensor histidine kinase [Haliscomenobacter hydrossis]|uniref:Signal transduction histidine kinase n=1 Tax=Haliscomenobacter hydrossis (strain ATCC 27775 / DSM 1100 / LMG 10767 / O) TaxID=760192 RepID=F4KSY6_HALH1|nr:sensor histidine kinase [Haliscomenobacter hydrossis]AEE49093.1 putative signal transduction histidine kinase [Haliscomenobacter hydrossis DSM 1100]
MRKTPITILFALLISAMTGQSPLADSLRRVYHKETNPEKKIAAYYALAQEAQMQNLDASFAYADTLEQMAKAAHSLEGEAKALHVRAKAYGDKGEHQTAIPLLKKQLSIGKQIKDLSIQADAYNALGGTYQDLLQNDSAQYYLHRAASLNEKLGDLESLASVYSNLGNVYKDSEFPDKAIEYLEKALKIRLQVGDDRKTIFTYNNLAVAYNGKNDFDKSMEYSRKGIDMALKNNNKFVAGVMIGGVCHLLHKLGKDREALPNCEKSIQYLQEANRETNLVFPYINSTAVYNSLGQPQKGLAFAMKGYALMQKHKLLDPLAVYYEEIARSYELLGQPKEALVWYKKFRALDDSLFTIDNSKVLADMEAKYQTQKKETEIINQQLKIEKQESILFRQQTWIWGLLVGLLAFVSLGWLFWNRFRLRKKAELDAALIQEQKLGLNAVIEAQEAERKRIAKDLHDGIAQEMVALKLGFSALQSKIAKVAPQEALQIGQLAHQLDESCTEVRNISHTMLPPMLEQHGLAPSLEMLLRNTFQSTALQYEFESSLVPEHLDEKVEIGVYRVAQELLNNIVKHANAGKVLVILYLAGGSLILRMEDDGQGFDFERARAQGSMGLLNILSRVSTLGGVFQTEAASPKGTISIIRIPLNNLEK